MYIDEPNRETYPNPIKKFEFKPNLIIAEPELKLEPCDIGTKYKMNYDWQSTIIIHNSYGCSKV